MSEALFSVGPVKVCCSSDPAIDGERSDVGEYTTSRDPKHIVEAEGKHITWFHVKRLKRSRLMEIDSGATNQKHALVTAFRECVVRVDNLTLANGDFTPTWLPEYATAEDWGNKRRILSEAELDHFLRHEIYEIGDIALGISNLRPGRPALFLPLDTSARAMAETAYHRAVAIQAAASPDSANPSSVTAETPTITD